MPFESWIENIIKTEQPSDEIVAYNFGIFETTDGYTLYLIGSNEYDEDDSDWACNNDFEPSNKYFVLPQEFSKLDWENAQIKIVETLQNFITTDLYRNSFLSKAKAITTDFDDGDLITIKNN